MSDRRGIRLGVGTTALVSHIAVPGRREWLGPDLVKRDTGYARAPNAMQSAYYVLPNARRRAAFVCDVGAYVTVY